MYVYIYICIQIHRYMHNDAHIIYQHTHIIFLLCVASQLHVTQSLHKMYLNRDAAYLINGSILVKIIFTFMKHMAILYSQARRPVGDLHPWGIFDLAHHNWFRKHVWSATKKI